MTLCPIHTLFRFLCNSLFWYHLSLMPLDWPSEGQTGHAILFFVVLPSAWYKCIWKEKMVGTRVSIPFIDITVCQVLF